MNPSLAHSIGTELAPNDLVQAQAQIGWEKLLAVQIDPKVESYRLWGETRRQVEKVVSMAHRQGVTQRDLYISARALKRERNQNPKTDKEAKVVDWEREHTESRENVATETREALANVLETQTAQGLSMLAALLEGQVTKGMKDLEYGPDRILHALLLLEKGEAYENFTVSKKNGKGNRRIDAPHYLLKGIQRRLHDRLLKFVYLDKAAVGFRPQYDAVRGLTEMREYFEEVPIACAWSIDIDNFFPSITSEMLQPRLNRLVKGLLGKRREGGYPKNGPQLEDQDLEEMVNLIIHLVTVPSESGESRHLIQGAPSSPMLSNMVATPIDKEIQGVIREYEEYLKRNSGEPETVKVWYGRYADDLVFFASHPLPQSLKDRIKAIIKAKGLKPKPSKERWMNFAKPDKSKKQKAAEKVGFLAWGYAVQPGKDEKPNTFGCPPWQMKQLEYWLKRAMGKTKIKKDAKRLKGIKDRSQFAQDSTIGKVFGHLSQVSYAYRNSGQWDPNYPKVPEPLHRLYVQFLNEYADVLSQGGKPFSDEQRAEAYMGNRSNPFARRNEIPPSYERMERYTRKPEPELADVIKMA